MLNITSKTLLAQKWVNEIIPYISFNETGMEDANLVVAARVFFIDRATKEVPINIGKIECGIGTLPPEVLNNHLFIMNLSSDGGTEAVREAVSKWKSEHEQFKSDETVNRFVDSKTHSKFYDAVIDTENHATVVFYCDSNPDVLRLTYSIFPRLAPWYLAEHPVTGKEKEFIAQMFGTSSGDNSLIAEIEERLGLKDMAFKQELHEMLKGNSLRRIENLKMQVASAQDECESYLDRYRKKYKEAIQLRESLETARIAQRKQDFSEFLRYIDTNRSVHIVDIDENTITFDVHTYLSNWDADEFCHVIDNDDSYIWCDDCGDYRTSDQDSWRELFEDIFLYETKRLRFCARFKIDVVEGTARSMKIPPDEVKSGYMQNPHAYHYGCLGSYEDEIVRCILEGDLISAFGMCINSAGNFNFEDSTVGDSFFDSLFRSSTKCVELSNGTVHAPSDLV